MSCTSPLTVAEHDAALAAGVGLLHVGFEVGDRRLHGLGRLQHERQLHLAGTEQLADDLHASEQGVVDDVERGHAAGQGLVQIGLEAVAVPVDDALVEAALDGPAAAVFLARGRRPRPLRTGASSSWQRVVAPGRVTAVVDQVEAHLDGPRVDLVERHDPGRVDDGGVEAGLLALVQEDRVEGVAGGRVQAEATRWTSPTMVPTPGSAALMRRMPSMVSMPSRRLSSMPVDSGSTRGSKSRSVGVEPVALDGQVVDGLGRPQLPLGGAGLALGVDAGADDGRAVLAGQATGSGRAGCPGRRRPRG